jgi:flagellar protein FliJ
VTSFRFRLERVRAVRERSEQLAQEELARSITRLSDSEAHLRSVEADLEQAREHQRDASATSGTVGAAELMARQAFLERVELQRSAQQLELTRSEADVADRNAELTTAAVAHEMLVRLRDRRRSEHDREQARVESNLHDEIASVRYHRTTA